MSKSFNWPIAIILSILLWIILIPILSPIFLVLGIYKFLVYIFYKIVRSDLEILNASDVGVVDNVKKRTVYNIGVLFILETDRSASNNNGINVKLVRENFADLFLRPQHTRNDGYRKLKKVYKSYGGYYFWEDAKDFNIENHISEHTIKCEQDLDEYVSSWIKSPYPNSVPMWSMALIKWNNGKTGKLKSAVTFRIHHAYADGISVLQLAHKLAGTTPSSIPSHRPRTIGFGRKAILYFVFPYILKRMMSNLFSAPNPFKNIPVMDDSFLVLTTVELQVVKKIKRNLNVPFATVLMTIVGGMVRRLIAEVQQEMPQYVCLGSALLWPFRPTDSLCNEWAAGMFKVPIADENPVERLKVTADDFQNFMKEGGHVVMKPLMFGLISLIPVGIHHRFVNPNKDTVPMAPAAIMSGSLVGNLNQTYSLWGSEVKHVYPIACNADPHIALGCISTSHGVTMDIAIVADASLFPKTSNLKEKLPKYFLTELEFLSKKADSNRISSFEKRPYMKDLMKFCKISKCRNSLTDIRNPFANDEYSVCNGEHTEKLQG